MMRQDLVYALRNMARSPGVSAVAVLTLALGVGANTAMFSIIHAVLLRPLPVREPDRLATIWARIPGMNIEGAFVEYNTFADWWRARSHAFKSMAAYTPTTATLSLGHEPQRLTMLRVSASYLSVIGISTALGRDFLPEEDAPGARRVAILSDGLWKRRFGAIRDVVGRPITLDRNSYTVVGVLPPNFDFGPEDILTPIAQSTARVRNEPSVGAYARLKPGFTFQAAQAEIDGLCRGWVAQYDYPRDWGARVWPLHKYLVRDVRPSVILLAVAVALVLLIACANIANLLLARAGARQREIAIRGAIGANRARIMRQLLTESALLASLAAVCGLLLAWASLRALVAAEVALPFPRNLALNGPVLLFTLAAALLTTLLVGLAPALAMARTAIAANLREGGHGSGEGPRRSGFRAALVAGEVALALLLVIGATLTVRSLARLQAVDPGFNPKGILTAGVMLPESGYSDPGRRANFFKALPERVGAIPGVQAVGLVSDVPFGGSKSGNDITVEGAPERKQGEKVIAFVRSIDPGYFRAMQVRLLRGRFFTPRDSSGPPVTIINETMARRCWPNQDAVGKRFGGGRKPTTWLTVVGVVAAMRSTSLVEEPDLEYFLPHEMMPPHSMAMVIPIPVGAVASGAGIAGCRPGTR